MDFVNLTQEEIEETLSPMHIHDLWKAFFVFQKQNAGYVLNIHLRSLLKSIGYNLKEQVIDNLITMVDMDKNGVIDFNEFLNLVANLESRQKSSTDARDMFNLFDKKEEGYIEAFDIKDALLWVLDKVPVEEREDVLNHFKLNKSRKVDLNEFKGMITSKQ